MIFYVFISLLATYLVFLSDKGKVKKGLEYGFLLVCFVSCIRYGFGNDYFAYQERFEHIARGNYSLLEVLEGDAWPMEVGYCLINWICKPLGFWGFTAFLTSIELFVYYNLIKKYTERGYRWIAVFIILLYTTCWPIHVSMYRQAFACAILACCIPFIAERRIWFVIPLIIFACTQHTSAIFFAICVPLGFIPEKYVKTVVLLEIVLFIIVSLFPESSSILFAYIQNDADVGKYMSAYGSANTKSVFNLAFLVRIIPYAFIINSLLKNDYEGDIYKRLILFCSLMSLMLVPLVNRTAAVARLMSYLDIYMGISLAIIYKKRLASHPIIVFGYCLYVIYNCFRFGYSNVFRDSCSEFHTIFEVL